ncbi:MAG TPA: pyrroline-5-carboxylate reductase [Candidatus Angelobacter sp.]|nr:pyrroline-5-carboxylate reductase [Candidatus Angelobacter sp.]
MNNKQKQTNGSGSHATLAVLGAGKMGGLLLAAIAKGETRFTDLRATVKHTHRAAALSHQLGLKITTDNAAAVRDASIVLLCMKPSYVHEALNEVRSELHDDVLIISIASAVSTHAIESAVGRHLAVVRAMPNTPCRIGKGMITLCPGRFATAGHLAEAAVLFGHMGRTAEVDEAMMDAVTGLSASGPAFIYTIIEALSEGGVRMGLPRELATTLAAQATLGAAAMVLETGLHPAILKSEVTTPGGCTVEGLLELETGSIRATLIRAIDTTTRKASTLAPSSCDGSGFMVEAGANSRRNT